MIRDQSERVINQYKGEKEKELEDVKAELELTFQTMRDKMRVSVA